MEINGNCFDLFIDVFEELKENHIHWYCNCCGTHKSNMGRIEGQDPKKAILMVSYCLSCAEKNNRYYEIHYFDENGIEISFSSMKYVN